MFSNQSFQGKCERDASPLPFTAPLLCAVYNRPGHFSAGYGICYTPLLTDQ